MPVSLNSQYDKRGYLKGKVVQNWRAAKNPGRNLSDKARLHKIEKLAEGLGKQTDDQLKTAALAMKEQVVSGKKELEDFIEPGFALVREAAMRAHGMSHYPCQIIAGLILVRGGVAEMATGEGKTLAVSLPAFAFALAGKGVHAVTVNSYLAERDFEFSQPIFDLLGFSVGLLPEREPASVKRVEYEKDITYGVGYEFGFDYLRDQLAMIQSPRPGPRERLRDALLSSKSPEPDVCQTGHPFVIIDEVDSVLIDEAGSPLVISTSSPGGSGIEGIPYIFARDMIENLEEDRDFTREGAHRVIKLTGKGKEKIYDVEGIPWDMLKRPWEDYILNALKAEHNFIRDAQYVVSEEGKVVIVDEFTGRRFEERTWREGLHQAVEAKEDVEINPENETSGSITRQRYFGFYDRKCGLTGTGAEAAGEFWRFFEMPTVTVPLHRPSQRVLEKERVFQSREAMFAAIAGDVESRHSKGQPILVGTRTIRESESLSEELVNRGIPHRILTAKQDEEENEIIATAGEEGQVLIATNMAGRGTHISLSENSLKAGGLHVVVVERNESKRIDRQLIGRGARQGEPGSAQVFVSADDYIVVTYAPDLEKQLKSARAKKNGELSSRFSRDFDRVQEEVERLRYEQRLSMAERDKWTEETRKNLA
ncbi:MAG: hypothetical protein P1V20_07300 [Verrucomicrobiales bacterium]|nr:hypothetical protein [Verrucomicrobiales bacterium]